MRHRVAGQKLSLPTAHRLALYRNLTIALIAHERIITTDAKAKGVRSMVEKVITLGKDGSLHARRQALQMINNEGAVRKVFEETAPRYADRSGGYMRILRLGYRKGDGAFTVLVELVK